MDEQIVEQNLNKRTLQLVEIRNCIGILERAKRDLVGAMLKARQFTPESERYGKRISNLYDEVKRVQDDMSRRYLT